VDGDRPARATRDNGLRCASYTPLADLDPRIADAMLEALRDHGIAAYAGPTPAASGANLELQLPDRPIDRLWVDERQLAAARHVVEEEQRDDGPPAGDDEIDFDAAWQQLLGSLQESPATGSVRISGASLARPEQPDVDDEDEDGYDPADDDHYEPPPPPPLPRLRKATAAALTAIALGLLVLATDFEGGGFTFLAVVAIVGGVASLIWNMRQGPPTDSGWDDGAVV
jgi:hypothetical protein